MNVFEDLVVELKEENLLEETVMDGPSRHHGLDHQSSPASGYLETIKPVAEPVLEHFHSSESFEPSNRAANPSNDPSPEMLDRPVEREYPAPIQVAEPGTVETADIQFQGNDETVEIRKAASQREFFKKRAVSEMTSLQMVEAVFTAIEREHLKQLPKAFDDFEAKKALHVFLQVADDVSSDEHKQAEFKLLHETESWCTALAERDRVMTVANLRRYCETCRPMLSSQAMLALARFYRNLPYSEGVRGKFDYIITRLFSRPLENEARKLLFTTDEMLGHLKTLYADWSSIPLYSAEDDESKISLTALSFKDLASESEGATRFDDLIKSDFFGRLRLFKESIAELFYAPLVTAAAIECNIRIGNRYVELIDLERRQADNASIHQRFADLDDETVSGAASRTLELVHILRERAKAPVPVVVAEENVEPDAYEDHYHQNETIIEASTNEQKSVYQGTFLQRLKANAFGVNRWFLAAAILIFALSAGLYFWGNYYAEPKVTTAGVKTLSFKDTEFAEQIKTAKLSGETLYVVEQPTLDGLAKDKQQELLQKLFAAGKEKGWLNVNLMNSQGKTLGFASQTRIEMINQ